MNCAGAAASATGLRLSSPSYGSAGIGKREGVAEGDVSGHGLWLLEDAGPDGVRLTYRWAVELERGWMRALAPVPEPLFAWRHFAVMRGGARGMAQHLGCSLGRVEEWSTLASAQH